MGQKVYANRFTFNEIIVFDFNGNLLQTLDFSELLNNEKAYNEDQAIQWKGFDKANNVLNGIAYCSHTQSFYMTGKNWHYLT